MFTGLCFSRVRSPHRLSLYTAEDPFVCHLGCAPPPGRPVSCFKPLGPDAAPIDSSISPQIVHCGPFAQSCQTLWVGGACAPWNDRWRDGVETCPLIFSLGPRPYFGDTYAGQCLLVSRALQQAAPKCSCQPSSSQTLSSIWKLSPRGCAERRKRTTAKRASLANDTG